jgi:hypothetical protein
MCVVVGMSATIWEPLNVQLQLIFSFNRFCGINLHFEEELNPLVLTAKTVLDRPSSR